MLTTIIVAVVALFVGWNLPQPSWAKKVQTSVEDEAKDIKSKL